jgi:predicted transcriptional regulator
MDAQQQDHDLLIELKTIVHSIKDDIRDLKEGTTERISCLERDKADRKEMEELQTKVNKDIEIRVRRLESWGFIAIGALMIIEFLFKFIIK